jgi:hypothetical protein
MLPDNQFDDRKLAGGEGALCPDWYNLEQRSSGDGGVSWRLLR